MPVWEKKKGRASVPAPTVVLHSVKTDLRIPTPGRTSSTSTSWSAVSESSPRETSFGLLPLSFSRSSITPVGRGAPRRGPRRICGVSPIRFNPSSLKLDARGASSSSIGRPRPLTSRWASANEGTPKKPIGVESEPALSSEVWDVTVVRRALFTRRCTPPADDRGVTPKRTNMARRCWSELERWRPPRAAERCGAL